MAWELKESGGQLPDGVVPPTGLPPPEDGNQAASNLFWWPAINRICVIVITGEGYPLDDQTWQLWTRVPGASVWELFDKGPSGWWITGGSSYNFDYGYVMAAVDDTDGSLIVCAWDRVYGQYHFARYVWSTPNLTGTFHPGSISNGFDMEVSGNVETYRPVHVPMMCSGTATTRPRLLGRIDSYVWASASYDPSASNGLAIHAATIPSTRDNFSMELDPVRDVIVIYGGETSPGVRTGEVWEGDGVSAYTIEHAGPGPGSPGNDGRSGAAMCYHAGLGGMLIYGGKGLAYNSVGVAYLGFGAWLWNGTIWAPALGTETDIYDPVAGGSANNHFFRDRARMAYDPVREVPVVFRGIQESWNFFVFGGGTV